MPAAVDTRPPLQTLTMSAAQRPKRRSARLAFEDEDGPIVKRSKLERSPVQAMEEPAVKARATKKSKASYTENSDGFSFKRGRSKSAKPEAIPPPAREDDDESVQLIAPSAPALEERPIKSAQRPIRETKEAQNTRKSQRIRSTSPAPNAGPSTPLKFKTRRKTVVIAEEQGRDREETTRNKHAEEQRQTLSEQAPADPAGDTRTRTITLPFADTPKIQRNKEFRAKGKLQNRRSSSGLRGRRASSLIENGNSSGKAHPIPIHSKRSSNPTGKLVRHSLFSEPTSSEEQARLLTAVHRGSDESFYDLPSSPPTSRSPAEEPGKSLYMRLTQDFASDFFTHALPHSDVDTRDFYKHIDQGLLEPQRMKQLLVWCGTRAMPAKQPGGWGVDSNEGLAMDSARQIQEELLKDFVSKPELSNWFARSDAGPSTIVKKPNPRNAQNLAKLKELEQQVESLRLEKSQWDTLLTTSKSPPAKELDLLPALLDLTTTSSNTDPDTTQDTTSSIATISLALASATRTQAREQITDFASKLEPSIDLLADGLHRLAQYRKAADGIARRILGQASVRMEGDRKIVEVVGGTVGMSPRDTLAALSGVLRRQRD